MLSEQTIAKVLDCGLQQGADFAEVFVEDSVNRSLDLLDKKIDQINSGNSYGIGVRLLFGGESCYGYSSDPDADGLLRLTENLAKSKRGEDSVSMKDLRREDVSDAHPVRVDPASVAKRDRVELLRKLDSMTRAYGDEIRQVSASIVEKKRSFLVANSEGLFREDSRQYMRVRLSAIADTGDGPQSGAESPGVLGGYEFLQEVDLDTLAREAAETALRMARAGYIEGGVMPVVMGNGFGGVIFHEACGHPLETESIRKNASPFVGKVGQQIASPILTAIDDGTIANAWGSINIDDEGNPAQRTVLIKDGVLQQYMSDRVGAGQVGVAQTGSSRRENFKYAPVSRMRNTFIDRGPNRVDEILQSVEYGLYAKKLGGGSVDPGTGEFNFAVQEGYIIRNGKVAEPVRGATLIGKGYEVLPRISMIADDLELAAGICGASSGLVPTTVGQPTLKIDSILVGGR
jgi:TldD protein